MLTIGLQQDKDIAKDAKKRKKLEKQRKAFKVLG